MRSPRLVAALALAVSTASLTLVAAVPQVAGAAPFIGRSDVPVVGASETGLSFSGDDGQNSSTVTGLPIGSDGGVALSPLGHAGVFTRGLSPRAQNALHDSNDKQLTFFDPVSRTIAATVTPGPGTCWDPAHPAYSPNGSWIAVLCATAPGVATSELAVLSSVDGSILSIKDYGYPNIGDVAWSPSGTVLYFAGAGVRAVPWNGTAIGDYQQADAESSDYSLAVRADGTVVATSNRQGTEGFKLRTFTGWSGSGGWTPTTTAFALPGSAGQYDLSLTADGNRAVIEPDQGHLQTIDLTTGTLTGAQSLTLGGYYISGFSVSAFDQLHVISSDSKTWRMDTWTLAADGSMSDIGLVSATTTQYPGPGSPAIGTASAPVASFTNTAVSAGGTMSFDASGSTIATSTATYHWDFGDPGSGASNTATTTTPSASHLYATSGARNVTLTVTDATGAGDPSTTWWDGTHYVRQGSDSAVRTRAVNVNGNSSISLSVTPASVTRGGHFHVSGTLTYPPGPAGSHFSSNTNHVTIYRNNTALTGDSSICNSPVVFSNDATLGTFSFSCDGPTENTVGPVAWRVGFDGDGTINASESQEADTSVTTIATSLAVSGVPAEQPAATSITATATLSATPASCGGGTYSLAVDGVVVATKAAGSVTSTSETLTAPVTAGRHTVKALWAPASGDTTCLSSFSPEVSTVTGSNPTTTTLKVSVATSPQGAAVPLTVAVTSPGGNPAAGTITVKDGTTAIGTAAVSATGTATLSPAFSTFGPHALTAVFTYPTAAFAGSTSAASTVSVIGAPSAPAVLTSPKPGKLLVGFVADPHGSPITSYAVTCSAKKQKTRTASGPGPLLTVSGLTNNVDYQCSATATNAVGTSPRGASAKGRPGKLPTVTLKAPTTRVSKGKGKKITLTGTVTAANQPQTRRLVTLTFTPSGSKVAKVLATTHTDSKGRFTFHAPLTAKGTLTATAPVGPSLAHQSVTVRLEADRKKLYA